jgi:heme-degrading monooxygenase HmoA
MTRTYRCIWTFHVHPEHVEPFRRNYGEGGAWTQLFRRARGYLGTELLQDEKDSLRFVTIDTWSTREDYEVFQASHASEYAALDRLCEGLTIEETFIGHFASER